MAIASNVNFRLKPGSARIVQASVHLKVGSDWRIEGSAMHYPCRTGDEATIEDLICVGHYLFERNHHSRMHISIDAGVKKHYPDCLDWIVIPIIENPLN